MRSRTVVILLFLIVFISCSPGHEVVMPFRNWDYSVDRLFPISISSSDFTFRIWISNSTSIYRIISVSRDTAFNVSNGKTVIENPPLKFSGYLTEIGSLIKGKKYSKYYNQIEIEPKGGFNEFKNKIDKLDLLNLSSQEPLPVIGHQPISTYTVEIMINKRFNSFKFESRYPDNSEIEDKYADIEKLIFEEFNIQQYFKFPK